MVGFFNVEENTEKGLVLVLERYRCLVETEKRKLQTLFSENQWALILESNNGGCNPAMEGTVLYCVNDFLSTYGDIYNCDFLDLLGKLTSLNLGQQFALDELIDDFWIGGKKMHN